MGVGWAVGNDGTGGARDMHTAHDTTPLDLPGSDPET